MPLPMAFTSVAFFSIIDAKTPRSEEDESMLEIVGHPYLMETAPDALKKRGFTPCRRVLDTLDEILIVPYISSSNKEVDTNKPVTIAVRIVKASDGSTLTPSSPTYKHEVYDGDTWNILRTVTTATVQITTADTDQNDGTSHEIVDIVTVEFDSLT